MSIENHRRISFLDDISPITADFMNDMQSVVFDTFSNLRLDATSGHMTLKRMEDGYANTENMASIVVAGKQRFPGPPADAPNPTSAGNYNILAKPGEDTGANTNINISQLDLEVSSTVLGNDDPVAGDLSRTIGVTHWDGTKYENTHTTAGAVARALQYNAFTFKSIDDNSTPLTIEGINGDKPNLVVDAEVTFKLHDDPDLAADGHITVDTAKGGIKTELIVAPDPTDPLAPSDPTVVIGHNVHIPGDITVDGDLIFDTHELGTIGASRWSDLLRADETLPWELSDCAFEHLLPNASHAPLNYYPLGTIIELATPSGGFSGPSTWPTGWLLMDDSIRWDMTDDNTVYWLTPLIEYFDGVGNVPADEWSVPGGTTSGGAYEHFIFLGPMSYLTMDSTSGEISVDTEAQERGREWTAIKWL